MLIGGLEVPLWAVLGVPIAALLYKYVSVINYWFNMHVILTVKWIGKAVLGKIRQGGNNAQK